MAAKVIGSVNQKGGQGKSQGVHAMAMVLSQLKNKKVLVVDFDPQGAQRILLGFKKDILDEHPEANVSLIFEKRIGDVAPINVSENVDAILSDYTLTEYSERAIKNKENLLKKLVNRFRDDYDFILIDSQPTVGALMSSVVLASDNLFVPIRTNLLDEEGTIGFFDEFLAVLDAYDKYIGKITLVPNLYESGVNDNQASLVNIRENFPSYLAREFTGIIAVTDPIPKRSLFGAAAADSEIHNVLEFIKLKSRKNIDIAALLEKITDETIGGEA